MLHWIDQIVRGCLLVVAVGLTVLWFRSHSVGDRYRWQTVTQTPAGATVVESSMLLTGDGGIAYLAERLEADDLATAQRLRGRAARRMQLVPTGYMRVNDPRYPVRSEAPPSLSNALGIHYHSDQQRDGAVARDSFSITLPLWMPAVLFGVYPIARYVQGVVARERRERILLGLCPRCGTDVREHLEQCPTCGKRSPLGPRPLATN